MKAVLRKRYGGRGREPAAAHAALQVLVRSQLWWDAAFCVGLFRSVGAEPDTGPLLADAFRLGAKVAVPVAGRDGRYSFRYVEEGTGWVRGAHGILEPEASAPVPPGELRVILVPGVAFDAAGTRLGHGGGNYDRLLAGFPEALLVGVAFESRMAREPLPREAHDVAMDAIATEAGVRYLPGAAAKLARLLEGAR
jgi:5-formyltetrahydrofolate cyclo-ligase